MMSAVKGNPSWSGGVYSQKRSAADPSYPPVCSPLSKNSARNIDTNVKNVQDTRRSSEARMCAGCGLIISDRYLLSTVEQYWHADCLKCTHCHAPLADLGPTCFSKSGMTLCKQDYLRLFGATGTCRSCCQPIPANEFVMRSGDRVYHVPCFACSQCHTRLVPGDRYAVLDGALICEQDYWSAQQHTAPSPYIDPLCATQPPQQSQQRTANGHVMKL